MKSNTWKKTAYATAAIILLAVAAYADDYDQTINEVIDLLKTVGATLALVLLGYYAISWIMADSPQSRGEAKVSLKWILIGLVLLAIAHELATNILDYAVDTYY